MARASSLTGATLIAWFAAGPFVFGLTVDPHPEVLEIHIAIIASSAICAWLCRSSKWWEAL